MKTAVLPASAALLMPFILGIAVIAITYAGLSGKQVPLVGSPRAALIALLIVGMAMCTGGIGQVGVSGHWASPLAILGYVLGAVILVVIAAGLFGWTLPLISGDKDAVLATAVLIAIKYLIGTVSYFFHWL